MFYYEKHKQKDMAHGPSFKIGIYQATLKITVYMPIETYSK